jgi:4-amino-4-deoxy-L-arabinose transferase-like glycosyltransferase
VSSDEKDEDKLGWGSRIIHARWFDAVLSTPGVLCFWLLWAVIGVGFLAKWSFFFVVLGLGIALCMDEKSRRVFADPRSLIIPLVAGLVVLPSLLWVVHLDPGILASNVN